MVARRCPSYICTAVADAPAQTAFHPPRGWSHSPGAPSYAGDSVRRRTVETLLSEAPAPTVVGLTVGLLARDGGGWYPAAWDWAALSLMFIAACALILLRAPTLGRLDVVMLSALAGFTAWTGLSWTWSESPPRSELELERSVMYLAGVLALLLVAKRRSGRLVLACLFLADLAVCAYALATRLFPDWIQPAAGDIKPRLGGVFAYPNALGIAAVIALLLAFGFLVEARRPAARAVTAAALPMLGATLLFTVSRGAWISLGVGIAAAVAIAPARRCVLAVLIPTAAEVALAVWLSSRSKALTRWTDPAAAAHAGHLVAAELAALTLVATVAALTAPRVQRLLVRPAVQASVALACVIGVAALLAVVLASGHGGAISTAASPHARPANSTVVPPDPQSPDPQSHIFATGSDYRTEYWRVALEDFVRNPLVGSGAGTFAIEWQAHRRVNQSVQDAHSLYLETGAELGCIGLLLLVCGLAVPAVAAFKARSRPLVVGAFGAYAAALAHAAVDWDWELPAVMLMGIFCGAVLVVAARDDPVPPLRPMPARIRALALAPVLAATAFSLVCLIGDKAYASALRAAWRGDWSTAESQARRARAWAPWSAEPLVIQADATSVRGSPAGAASLLREAVRKDPHDADLWQRLSSVTTGSERAYALKEAKGLDPFGTP